MAMCNWLLLIALALLGPVASQSESRFLSEERLVGQNRLTSLSRKGDRSLQPSRACPKTLPFGYKLNSENGYRSGDSIRRIATRHTIEQNRPFLESTRFSRIGTEKSYNSKRAFSDIRYRTRDAIQERAFSSRERAFERISSNGNGNLRSEANRRYRQEARVPVFFDFRFREAYRRSQDIPDIRDRRMFSMHRNVEGLTLNGKATRTVFKESMRKGHEPIHSRRNDLVFGKETRMLSRRTRSSDRVTHNRHMNLRSRDDQNQEARNEERSVFTRRTQLNEERNQNFERSTVEPHRESRRLPSRRISEREHKHMSRLQSIRRDARDRVSKERYFDKRELSRGADARASTQTSGDKRDQLRQFTLNNRNVPDVGGMARKQVRRDIRAIGRMDKREQYRKPMEHLAGIDNYSNAHVSIESEKTPYYWKTYAIIAMQAVCVCGILVQILNSHYDKKKIRFSSLWPATKALKVD